MNCLALMLATTFRTPSLNMAHISHTMLLTCWNAHMTMSLKGHLEYKRPKIYKFNLWYHLFNSFGCDKILKSGRNLTEGVQEKHGNKKNKKTKKKKQQLFNSMNIKARPNITCVVYLFSHCFNRYINTSFQVPHTRVHFFLFEPHKHGLPWKGSVII